MSFLANIAYADGQTATAAPTQMEALLESALPMMFIFGLMYFVMIRPQSKKAKEQAEFLLNLKPGTEVVTTGGIIGQVRTIADVFVTIDSGSTSFKVQKEHISSSKKAQNSNKMEKKPKVATASKN